MRSWNSKSTSLLCLLLIAGPSLRAAAADVQVLSSSETEVSFIINTDAELSSLEQVATADDRLAVSRLILVGVSNGASVRLLSADGRKPVGVLRVADTDVQRIDAGAPLVQISRPFEVRGRRMVSVRVNPVDGARVFSETEIKLGFVGGSRVAPLNVFDITKIKLSNLYTFFCKVFLKKSHKRRIHSGASTMC